MTRVITPDSLTVLLPAEEVQRRVATLADAIAPTLSDDAVVVCLLTGGLWFAADLTRALAERGRHPAFDALWLASYGDAASSSGRVEVRGPLQRPVAGRPVLLVDEVVESGHSLTEAARLCREAGAADIRIAVFADKPYPGRTLEPEFCAWQAPDRFLVGYGMDYAGTLRGLPFVGAAD